MRPYTERCEYDAVGNILRMIHQASNGNWTRAYAYNEAGLIEDGKTSNRLSSTQIGSGPLELYTYDAHGSMTTMPHLPLMEWDYRDQLQASSRQVRNDGGTPEITYYVYAGGGQRVRKVTERAAGPGETPTRMKERIYLGGFEIYREYDTTGSTVSLERETLHLMDGQQRVALVETRTQGDDGSPAQLIRYQLGNHLGTASLELDKAGEIISFEEYYPYGSTSYQAVEKSIKAAAKRYRYTGKERDEETGLNYHGARYYAGWLGRWCAVDPAETLDDLNRYRYARNNPTRLYDPNGKWPLIPLLLMLPSDAPTTGVTQSTESQTAGGDITPSAMTAGTVITSPPQGPQSAPNRAPDTPPRVPRPPGVDPAPTPTPPGAAPRPTPTPGPSPFGILRSGLVGGAIAGMILGPAIEMSRPCDPAICGLDFSMPEEEDFEYEYDSPVDQLVRRHAEPGVATEGPVSTMGARSRQGSRTSASTQPASRDEPTEEGERVWRALNEDDVERLKLGLRLRPKGVGGSILDQVQGKPTKYISASSTEAAARLMESAYGVAEIDVEKLLGTGSTIVNHENVLLEIRTSRGGRQIDRSNAQRTQEVLIKNGIDPSAIVDVTFNVN